MANSWPTIGFDTAANEPSKIFSQDYYTLHLPRFLTTNSQVLRDYYASKKDDDASLVQSDLGRDMSLAQTETHEPSGIIGMLEVAESDFTKLLAEGNADEDVAQKDYDKFMEDNKVATAAKEQEVKYKGMDAKETKAYLETTKADLQTAQTELGAILEYWEKLQPECVAKPEPYAGLNVGRAQSELLALGLGST